MSEQHAFPLEIVSAFVKRGTVEHLLTQALLAAPMFAARWRWNLGRALAIPRFQGGKRVPPPIQRMRADDLLAAVFPDQAACAENLTGEIRIPDHPLVKETIGDCLHEAMDLEGLRSVLEGLESGAIRAVVKESVAPSPFSHEIVNANPYAFLDDAPLEERRARAVQMRRTFGDGELVSELGRLDPEAIRLVEEQSWPVVRNADELHDALSTLVVLPVTPEWEEWFEALRRERRAACFGAGTSRFWVAAERIGVATRAYAGGTLESELASVPGPAPESAEEAAVAIVRGWLDSTGPRAASALSETLALPMYLVESALHRLEAEGQVLRGHFTASPSGELEWCQRRLLARIHRLTLGALRREIAPVSTAVFVRFLSRWQHVAPESRLHGIEGLSRIIGQLQGYEAPAASWERHLFPSRLSDYRPESLDRLCFSGEVAWGRLSPPPGVGRTSRSVPIGVFLRGSLDWLLSLRKESDTPAPLSENGGRVLDVLRERGASFFAEILRASDRSEREVELALRELVASGQATADGFDALRAVMSGDRNRRAGGRWSLMGAALSSPEATTEIYARQLLSRWGIVFRDLMARETLAPPWRDLLLVYRKLEARGEIRGGRFVSGFLGEQFALPEAVELVRVLRRNEASRGVEPVEIGAADPLNLTGFILPGDRLSALSTRTLVLENGVAVTDTSNLALSAR